MIKVQPSVQPFLDSATYLSAAEFARSSTHVITLTGTFERGTRGALAYLIQEAGIGFSKIVTKKTTVLVVGWGPGAKALAKAQHYGIPLMLQSEFYQLFTRPPSASSIIRQNEIQEQEAQRDDILVGAEEGQRQKEEREWGCAAKFIAEQEALQQRNKLLAEQEIRDREIHLAHVRRCNYLREEKRKARVFKQCLLTLPVDIIAYIIVLCIAKAGFPDTYLYNESAKAIAFIFGIQPTIIWAVWTNNEPWWLREFDVSIR